MIAQIFWFLSQCDLAYFPIFVLDDTECKKNYFRTKIVHKLIIVFSGISDPGLNPESVISGFLKSDSKVYIEFIDHS